jgi:predicted hotdog family 3-hydroxylacyl-ACP dehydratase
LADSLHSVPGLIPHKGPALFLEQVVSWSDRVLSARLRVPSSSPFAREGSVPALASVELGAQAAAAHASLRAGASGEGGSGYLVGVKELSLRASDFPADRTVDVEVALEVCIGQLAGYGFELRLDGALVARGAITTWMARAS